MEKEVHGSGYEPCVKYLLTPRVNKLLATRGTTSVVGKRSELFQQDLTPVDVSNCRLADYNTIVEVVDRLRIGWLKRGMDTRQEDEGSPTQSRISPSIQRMITRKNVSPFRVSWYQMNFKTKIRWIGNGKVLERYRLLLAAFRLEVSSVLDFTCTRSVISKLSTTFTVLESLETLKLQISKSPGTWKLQGQKLPKTLYRNSSSSPQ